METWYLKPMTFTHFILLTTSIIILQMPYLTIYAHCFYKVSSMSKMWAYFYQCHPRQWRRRHRREEAPKFKFLYFKKNSGDVFVYKIKEAQASIIFSTQTLCNYFCIRFGNTGGLKILSLTLLFLYAWIKWRKIDLLFWM